MKVLFAVGSAVLSEKIASTYFATYNEKIEYKDVFYFKAILEEVKRDKSYDRIVIAEQLEPMQNNVIDEIDKMLFNNIDSITDEIEDSTIIFICSDNRNRNDALIARFFNLGIYNVLIGDERQVNFLCKLIKDPRNKKEAKEYLKTNPAINDTSTQQEDGVNENELLNICRYFDGLRTPDDYLQAFATVKEQYEDKDLIVIVAALTKQLRRGKDIFNTLNSDSRYSKYCEWNKGASQISHTETKKHEKKGFFGFGKNKGNDNNKEPIEMDDSRKNYDINPISDYKSDIGSTVGAAVGMAFGGHSANSQDKILQDQLKAQQDAQRKFEEETRRKQEQIRNQEELIRKQQEELLKKQQEQEKLARDEKFRLQQEQYQKAQQEEQFKKQQELLRQQQEAQLKTQQEAQAKAQQEELLRAQQAELARQQQEAQLKAQQEAQARAQQAELARQQQEAQLKAQQAELARQQQEAQLKAQQAELARQQQEAQLKAQQAELARQQQEAQLKAQQEAQARAQQAELARKQQEAQLKAQQEARRKQEDEFARQQEQLRLQQEELRRQKEELARQTRQYSTAGIGVTTPPSGGLDFSSYDNRVGSVSNMGSSTTGMGRFNTINNIANDIEDDYNSGVGPVIQVPADYKKVVAFVGTNKVGTTFLVNCVATLMSMKGVKTSMLDMTKNRGLYWFYEDDTKKYSDVVATCMSNLSTGTANAVPIGRNRNLSLYTTIPKGNEDNRKGYRHRNLVDTAKRNCNLLIIDCDFSTPFEYFEQAQDIYIVQDLDLIKIVETKEFFRELKARHMDWSKLRMVFNNVVPSKITTKKLLNDALTYYSDISETYTEEFERIKRYIDIPLNPLNYANYVESIGIGRINYDKFTPEFRQAIETLSTMVYGVTSRKKGLFG